MYMYFIHVLLGIALAWGIYRLALRKKASAKTNRYFLLGGLILPFILPLITVSPEVVSMAEPILLPAVEIGPKNVAAPEMTGSNNWILYIYLGGVLSMLLYHLSGIFHFLKAINRSAKSTDSDHIYELENAHMPFSFFGRVFLPANLLEDDKNMIIGHEQLHIQRKHSWDVMVGACVQSALWFFPLLPFYLRDLRQEHEFEVDQLMLEDTAFSDYAETLLQFNLKPIHHRLFHSFSSPNLKTRIIMMTKNQKKNTWKLMLLLPVIGSMIYLNACSQQKADVIVEGKPVALKMQEVDVPPLFTTCADAASKEEQKACFSKGMLEYLVANIKYPEKAMAENVEGKVFVGFTIDENGNLESPVVKRTDVSEEHENFEDMLEMAALNVFADFPQLVPAQKDGQAVSVEYVVPISYKLTPEDKASAES